MPSTTAHDVYVGTRVRGWVFFVNQTAELVSDPSGKPWQAWDWPLDVDEDLLAAVLHGLEHWPPTTRSRH